MSERQLTPTLMTLRTEFPTELGISAAVAVVEGVGAHLLPKPAGLENDLPIVAVGAGWVGYVSGWLLRNVRFSRTKWADTKRRIGILLFSGVAFVAASYWYFALYHQGGIYEYYITKVYVSFTLANGLLFFIAGFIGLQLQGLPHGSEKSSPQESNRS